MQAEYSKCVSKAFICRASHCLRPPGPEEHRGQNGPERAQAVQIDSSFLHAIFTSLTFLRHAKQINDTSRCIFVNTQKYSSKCIARGTECESNHGA